VKTPRRAFLRSLAAAPLLPATLGTSLGSQTSPEPSAPGAIIAQAFGDVVRLRYGTQLRPADLQDITKAIEENLSLVEPLRKLKLGNGDEPVTTFSPKSTATKRPRGSQ
jgi:hypothetical protein